MYEKNNVKGAISPGWQELSRWSYGKAKKLLFRSLWLGAVFGAGFVSLSPMAGAAPFAYVSNATDNIVSVIDAATNTEVRTIPVGASPNGVAVHPAGTFVYVANTNANDVSVISTATNAVVATVGVGGAPYGVAVHPAGTFVYVTNFNTDDVSVIDTATNTVTRTISVGSGPSGVAADTAGSFVYVASTNSDTVTMINAATNTVVRTIPVGGAPNGVDVHPAGTFVYVANRNSNSVSVISTATNTVAATVPVGGAPYDVKVLPTGTFAYCSNRNSNSVSVIETSGNTLVHTIAVDGAPSGVAAHPEGTFVYVANQNSNTVSVIDAATGLVSATVNVGLRPIEVALIGPTLADLAVEKTVSSTSAEEGDSIAYTITVTNNGPKDATGVKLTDKLADQVSHLSDDSGGSYDSSTGIWDVGGLARGGSAFLRISVSLDQTGNVINTAGVSASDQVDPLQSNNESSVEVRIFGTGDDGDGGCFISTSVRSFEPRQFMPHGACRNKAEEAEHPGEGE